MHNLSISSGWKIRKYIYACLNGAKAGALLIDLSKAFDCIDHELLIAKLYACGFQKFLVLY